MEYHRFFAVVVSSIVDMAISSAALKSLRVLRMLRALRPLRFISHNESMKMIINSLANSMGGIISTLIVVIIVYGIFAILGMNMYAGKFFYCDIGVYDYPN